MLCKWRAKGVFPGEIPYECSGKARFAVRKRQWSIDPCNNINEPMIPLRGEVGPHPAFGYNDDWVQQIGKLDSLAGSGANVARTGLYWDAVQPTSFNVHGWTVFDALYQQMLARGIRPLFTLYAAPCWAQAGACRQGAHPSPDHYDELADFAARAAQRYPQAIGIEVWNEPNYAIYWGGAPDPESYGEMLKAVVPAIKAANPSMPVVTAGLSPHINDDVDAMAYETFLRRAYATGGPQLADAIGTHPYPNRRYIEDFLGNIRVNLFRYLRRDVRVRRRGQADVGDRDRRLQRGRRGLRHPSSRLMPWRGSTTLMRRIDHEIPVVVFHRYVDQPGHPSEPPLRTLPPSPPHDPRVKEQGYGVINPERWG